MVFREIAGFWRMQTKYLPCQHLSSYTLFSLLLLSFFSHTVVGGSMLSSHPSKLDPAEVPRGYLVESSGREGRTERGAEISKDPKCLLSK